MALLLLRSPQAVRVIALAGIKSHSDVILDANMAIIYTVKVPEPLLNKSC